MSGTYHSRALRDRVDRGTSCRRARRTRAMTPLATVSVVMMARAACIEPAGLGTQAGSSAMRNRPARSARRSSVLADYAGGERHARSSTGTPAARATNSQERQRIVAGRAAPVPALAFPGVDDQEVARKRTPARCSAGYRATGAAQKRVPGERQPRTEALGSESSMSVEIVTQLPLRPPSAALATRTPATGADRQTGADRAHRHASNSFASFTPSCPQQRLYFLPDPQGQGSFRPDLAPTANVRRPAVGRKRMRSRAGGCRLPALDRSQSGSCGNCRAPSRLRRCATAHRKVRPFLQLRLPNFGDGVPHRLSGGAACTASSRVRSRRLPGLESPRPGSSVAQLHLGEHADRLRS